MKRYFSVLLMVVVFCMYACNSGGTTAAHDERNAMAADPNTPTLQSNQAFVVDTQNLLKDFTTWYSYTYNNIHLARNFIGVDVDSNEMKKATFLNHLATGNFFVLKILVRDNLPVYRLFKFTKINQEISATMKQMALTEIEHFKMEGTAFPGYDFTDLNGKVYSNKSTKGKIVIIKCWFIHCVACVKEFPELNKLVNDYKDRNDMLFIGLAEDSKKELASFLAKRKFNYAVVPNMRTYITEQLSINTYPTHLLIDKNGKIIKVANSIDDMIPVIKILAAKSDSE